MNPSRFDLYVRRDGGWQRLESLAGDDKDSALARGSALDADGEYEGVRIMAVVDYGNDRPPLETLTWISPHLSKVASVTRQMRTQAQAAERAIQARDMGQEEQFETSTEPEPMDVFEGTPEPERPRRTPRPRKQKPKVDTTPGTKAVSRLAMQAVIAFGVSAVLFVPMTALFRNIGGGLGWSADVQQQASFGVSLLIFAVLAAVLMGRVYRMHHADLQTFRLAREAEAQSRPAARPSGAAAKARTATGQKAVTQIQSAPEPEAKPVPQPVPEPEPEKSPPVPEKTGGLTENMRRDMLEFLATALVAIKDEVPKVNRHVGFGLNLFISGAAERYGEHAQLSPMQSFVLIREMVEALGNSADRVDAYCRQYGEYKSQERYMMMIQAGRTVMELHVSRDADPFADFSEIIKMWTSDAAARAQVQGIVCIMFTDIVGSTQMTHERGDYGAQELVRVHNAVVRSSLAAHHGREVKHTGDGIMASFGSSAHAARCALDIQGQLLKHNAQEGALPVNIRIGLNAGEAVEEEDDFFGTTVQVAARVCDKADTGEVFVTDNVRELAKGQGIAFNDAGQYEMKGVPQPMTLYRAERGTSGA